MRRAKQFFLKTELLTACTLMVACQLVAQVSHPDWEKYLERFAENSEQSQLMEQLEDWLRNPLDLNTASVQELLLIPGFPEAAAWALVRYREKHPFTHLEQAKKLITSDDELWNWLVQFITVQQGKVLFPWHIDGRTRVGVPGEKALGYQNGKYSGSSLKLYQRYRIRIPERLQLATLMEKDPGEISYFDHHVFNFEYRSPKSAFTFILGDYSLNLGSGLMVWFPFVASKGSAPFYAARRNERFIRPYLSSYESNYFRGLAMKTNPGYFEFIGWLSKNRWDAGLSPTGIVSSLPTSGYHRTILEQQKRDQLTVISRGGALGWAFPQRFHFQLTAMSTQWRPAVALPRGEPEKYRLNGTRLNLLGGNFSVQFQHFFVFGELVTANYTSPAMLLGCKGSWQHSKLLLLYRNYSPEYHNPFANGFGEWSHTSNESGWYFAWRFSPSRNSKFTLASDQFATLWKTYQTPLPQAGNDLYLQWEQRVDRSFQFYFRYYRERKFTVTYHKTEYYLLRKLMLPIIRERIRLHFRIVLPHDLEIRGRIETSRYHQPEQVTFQIKERKRSGWLLYWDFRFSPFSNLLLFTRLTFFDTPIYETRIYQFENDLPGVLGSKLLYGRGVRFYLLVRWKLGFNLQLSGKYASTRYENRNVIGSSWDIISSPIRHFYSIQLDWGL